MRAAISESGSSLRSALDSVLQVGPAGAQPSILESAISLQHSLHLTELVCSTAYTVRTCFSALFLCEMRPNPSCRHWPLLTRNQRRSLMETKACGFCLAALECGLQILRQYYRWAEITSRTWLSICWKLAHKCRSIMKTSGRGWRICGVPCARPHSGEPFPSTQR